MSISDVVHVVLISWKAIDYYGDPFHKFWKVTSKYDPTVTKWLYLTLNVSGFSLTAVLNI